MAEAIVRGVLRGSVLPADHIIAADPSAARRQLFTDSLHIRAVEQAAQAAGGVQTLLLSVKPQQMEAALRQIAPVLAEDTLIISIAAGVSTQRLEAGLGTTRRVIRAMPNTPMLVGAGMVALCRGKNATEADMALAGKLFACAAEVLEVNEAQMDAVTAVSGSGPAYFFYLVEQMIAAGVALGLTPRQAHTLATRTALGSAQMLCQSADSPAELRRKVTSPNGTTHAAISHMEQRQVGQALVEAVQAAARRSAELGA